MSTSVVRYAPPLLPAVVSWYATPSPPLSKFAASTRPGIATGVPLNGASPPDDVGPAVFTTTALMLTAPVSKSSVICCTPAPSVTGTATLVHACQPPVVGIATVFQTELGPLKPMCSDAPLTGDATRSVAT